MAERISRPSNLALLRLCLEFIALYLLIPVMMATVLPGWSIGPILLLVSLLTIVLLQQTRGFHWRQLKQGRWIENLCFTLLFAILTALISTALVLYLLPGQFLGIPRQHPMVWLALVVLYPLLSALPQELIFRVLFVERYRWLFPDTELMIAVNAACFGLAHIFYENWTAPILSAVGGLVFAWAYVYRHSFAYAVLLQAMAGVIIFTSGLGIFFYHGAIGRM